MSGGQLAVWRTRMEEIANSPLWRGQLAQEYLADSYSEVDAHLAKASTSGSAADALVDASLALLRGVGVDAPPFLRSLNHSIPEDRVVAAAIVVAVGRRWQEDRKAEDQYYRGKRATTQADADESKRFAAERWQSELRAKLTRERRRVDRHTIVAVALLCATLVGPWLIGHYLLRDRFFRTPGAGVFDTQQRIGYAYFLSDWAAGCAPILVLGAVVLVVRPWHGRGTTVAIGFLAAALALGAVAVSSGVWNKEEAITASRFLNTGPPASDRNCGSAEVSFGRSPVESDRPAVTYTLVANHRSTGGETSCDQVQLYKGQRLVTTEALGGKNSVPLGAAKAVTVKKGRNEKGTTFRVLLNSKKVLTFNLAKLLGE